jgi:hypothetical protein
MIRRHIPIPSVNRGGKTARCFLSHFSPASFQRWTGSNPYYTHSQCQARKLLHWYISPDHLLAETRNPVQFQERYVHEFVLEECASGLASTPLHGMSAFSGPYLVYGNLDHAVRKSITWKVPRKQPGMVRTNGKSSTISNPLRPPPSIDRAVWKSVLSTPSGVS